MRTSCNGVSADLSWTQRYSANFSGSVDPVNGQVTMTGTLTGSQIVTYHNCTGPNGKSITCPSDTQPASYSFSLQLSGTIPRDGFGSSGQIAVQITPPTTGTWSAHP